MVQRLLERSKKHKKDTIDSQEDLNKDRELNRKRVNNLIKQKRFKEVKKLVKNEDFQPWSRDTQAKVCGGILIHFYLQNCPFNFA